MINWLNKNRVGFLMMIVLLLMIWQILSLSTITHLVIPRPLDVLFAIRNQIKTGQAFLDIYTSMKHILIGFLIASILGVGLGLIISIVPSLSLLLSPFVDIFRPIPPVAWIPIAILWFGIGDPPAYFIVFLGSFFPIFTNTYFGARQVSRIHMNSALSLGAKRLFILVNVTLPSALPFILEGMRIGLGVGWICVITAELIGAQSGLGYAIQLSRIMLNMPNMVASMIFVGVIGFTMNRLMQLIENRLCFWNNLHVQ
jgi:ABC-type nitrate/sulfonate/bicarbonate transport system permease component